jgi:hypothetical protein
MEGNKRESTYVSKEVGVFEGKVVAINPSKQELEMLLNTTIEKDVTYNAMKKEENGTETPTIRLSFWLKPENSEKLKNVSFFIEKRARTNKDGNKYQYVNQVGRTAWGEIAANGTDLPNFFTQFLDRNKMSIGDMTYRQALIGEEELMNFVRSWLNFDYFSPDTNILLDWDKIFRNNYKELSDGMKSDAEQTILALATVRVVTDPNTEETKEFQSIYNKAFLPGYNIKLFRGTKFTSDRIAVIKTKESKKLQPHERFILTVSDSEYGCKDRYILEEAKEYDGSTFFENTDKVLSTDDADY